MAEMTLERTPAQIKVKRLLEKLEEQPMTPPEIAQFLCLSQPTTKTYIKLLHERGQIYIRHWTRNNVGDLAVRARPVWATGNKKDAAKPPRLTRKQLNRRRYDKIKCDPAAYTAMLAKAGQRYRSKTFKPRPDVAAAWVFREAA